MRTYQGRLLDNQRPLKLEIPPLVMGRLYEPTKIEPEEAGFHSMDYTDAHRQMWLLICLGVIVLATGGLFAVLGAF